jgi:hypothetical protein
MCRSRREPGSRKSVRSLYDQEMIVVKLPQTGGCQCGKIRYEITECRASGRTECRP